MLFVTSFNREIYEATGRHLLESFNQYMHGHRMLVCYEGVKPEWAEWNGHSYNLALSTTLRTWLEANRDVIPVSLGGDWPDPPTTGGAKDQYPIGDQRNWFCRNASRWFRKLAAVEQAYGYDDEIIWLDADCVFKQRLSSSILDAQLFKGGACFYFKGPDREYFENGVFGLSGRWGAEIFNAWLEVYRSGNFRAMKRWDDCFTLQHVIQSRPDIPTCDLGARIVGHSEPIPKSILGPYIEHRKGTHGRKLGIMK